MPQTGQSWNRPNRMYVHQFKQEVATTWKTGSSYITNISGSVNGPSAVAPKSGVYFYLSLLLPALSLMCKVNCPSLVGDILVEHNAVEDVWLHVLLRARRQGCTTPCTVCLIVGRVVLSRPYLSKSALSLLASLSCTSTWLLATPRCISTNVHITYHFPTLNGANGGDLIPTYTRFWCNSTRPIYTSTDISDVATSWVPCCSYFLFELMYIHPVWSVSAFSCVRRCSIVLFYVL